MRGILQAGNVHAVKDTIPNRRGHFGKSSQGTAQVAGGGEEWQGPVRYKGGGARAGRRGAGGR